MTKTKVAPKVKAVKKCEHRFIIVAEFLSGGMFHSQIKLKQCLKCKLISVSKEPF